MEEEITPTGQSGIRQQANPIIIELYNILEQHTPEPHFMVLIDSNQGWGLTYLDKETLAASAKCYNQIRPILVEGQKAINAGRSMGKYYNLQVIVNSEVINELRLQ